MVQLIIRRNALLIAVSLYAITTEKSGRTHSSATELSVNVITIIP